MDVVNSAVHPDASVTVTIASPAHREAGLETEAPLDHCYVNGPSPDVTVTSAEPLH